MDEAAGPPPAPAEMGFEAFQRIFGPIRPLSPVEAANLFDGAPFRWWVAGGWSVELEAEPRRFHEDPEISVPRRDVAGLRDWLDDYHLWDTNRHGIHYLGPDADLPADHDQL